MCGRYFLSSLDKQLDELLGLDVAALRIQPRYNIAPTQPVLAVRAGRDRRQAVHLRWDLVPAWARDITIGSRLINARSETAHEKPAFRHAFRRRRCLIPASGFYEWRRHADAPQTRHSKTHPPRQPHLITMADERPFAMAGLWEHFQDAEGNELETCTILTTPANELVGELHDRMPVILDPDDFDTWLDTTDEDVAAARALCQPCPAELMIHRPVSTFVNNARHEGPACIRPIGAPGPPRPDDADQTPTLF